MKQNSKDPAMLLQRTVVIGMSNPPAIPKDHRREREQAAERALAQFQEHVRNLAPAPRRLERRLRAVLVTAPAWMATLPTSSHPRAKECSALITVRDSDGGYYDLGQWQVLNWQQHGSPEGELLDKAVYRVVDTLKWFGEHGSKPEAEGGGGYGWVSEVGPPMTWLFEQVEQHLSDEERETCFIAMRQIRDVMLKTTRPGDSDIELRNYFTLLYICRKLGDQPEEYQLGDYTLATFRERIDLWVEAAEGGEGVAGSMYGLSELGYAIFGVLVLGAQEEFANIVRIAQQTGWQQHWCLSSNRQESMQDALNGVVAYSDVQMYSGFSLHHRLPLLAGIVVLGGDPELQATSEASGLPAGCVLDLLSELWSLGGAVHIRLYQILSFLDPHLIPLEPQRHNPQGLRVCPNIGLAVFREGDWMIQVHSPTPRAWYDHFVSYGTPSVRVWNGTHWIYNFPIYYMPHAADCNAALAAGFGRFFGGQEGPGHDIDLIERTATGFRLRGWTGGHEGGPWYSSFPAPEWLKRMEGLIGWDHTSKKLRVRKSWEYYERPIAKLWSEGGHFYNQVDIDKFTNAPALCWDTVSVPEQPTEVGPNEVVWTSVGGVSVYLKTTAPEHRVDEHLYRLKYPETGAAYRLSLLDDRDNINGGPVVMEHEVDLSGVRDPDEPNPEPGEGEIGMSIAELVNAVNGLKASVDELHNAVLALPTGDVEQLLQEKDALETQVNHLQGKIINAKAALG